MIPLLPKWVLNSNNPAFYDTESATAIEMVAKLYGSMNTLIDDYNKFVDNTNQIITDFNESTTKDIELFKVAMRQEFQDFINVVELKLQSQDKEIEYAVSYMKTNLTATLNSVLAEMKSNGEFSKEVLKVYADMVNDINVLNARINTFTSLEEGSTTGDAELTDARVDKDGVTHDNVGEHIRTVTSQLSSEIYEKSNNYFFKDEVKENHQINSSGDIVPYNGQHVMCQKVPVNYGETWYISVYEQANTTPYSLAVWLAFYTEDDVFISKNKATSPQDFDNTWKRVIVENVEIRVKDFVVPQNASYCLAQFNNLDKLDTMALVRSDRFTNAVYLPPFYSRIEKLEKTNDFNFSIGQSEFTNSGYGIPISTGLSLADSFAPMMNGIEFDKIAEEIRAKLYQGHFSHDSTLVVDENGIGYIAYVANDSTNGDSPSDVNAVTQLARLDLNTLSTSTVITNYEVAKNGDTVFGKTITSGVGVPNAIYKNGKVYVLFSAKCDDDNYYMMCRVFDTNTLTFGEVIKCSMIVDGATHDFTTKNIHSHIAELTDTDYFISMNAQIGKKDDIYYCGVCIDNQIDSGLIFTTADFLNFNLWLKPEIDNSNAVFECACHVVGSNLFYCLRQDSGYNMILSKIDISTKAILDIVAFSDCSSRPCFFEYDNNLYLMHSTFERGRTEIIKVNKTNTHKSIIVSQSLKGYIYPSVVVYKNEIYFSSTWEGVSVYIRKSKFGEYTLNDMVNRLVKIVSLFS